MKLFESDLAQAIYEIIANTSFRDEGEQLLHEIRVDEQDWNFELDKTNAKITIRNEDEEFEIIFHKTRKNTQH